MQMIYKLIVINLILIFLCSCASSPTMHLRGNVHSDKDVTVEYKKSEEQERYEEEVDKTKRISKVPLAIAVMVFAPLLSAVSDLVPPLRPAVRYLEEQVRPPRENKKKKK